MSCVTFVFFSDARFRFQLFFSDCPIQSGKICWETEFMPRSKAYVLNPYDRVRCLISDVHMISDVSIISDVF